MMTLEEEFHAIMAQIYVQTGCNKCSKKCERSLYELTKCMIEKEQMDVSKRKGET